MIDWEMVAPMVVMIVLTLTVGGVMVLRPIAKRLGNLIEVITREKLEGGERDQVAHLRDVLDTMNQRLQLLEERQEFTDRLLESRDAAALPRRDREG